MGMEIRPFGPDDESKIRVRKKSIYLPYARQIHESLQENEKIIATIPDGQEEWKFSTGVRQALMSNFNESVFISIGTEEDSERRVMIITRRPAEEEPKA